MCILANVDTAGPACAQTAVDVLVHRSRCAGGWDPERLELTKADTGARVEVYRRLTPKQLAICARGIQDVLSLSSGSRVLSLPDAEKHLALATILGTWAAAGQLHAPTHLRGAAIANGSREIGEYIERNAISTFALPARLAASLADQDWRSLSTRCSWGRACRRRQGCAVRTPRSACCRASHSTCPAGR